jgi:hypothetical protein
LEKFAEVRTGIVVWRIVCFFWALALISLVWSILLEIAVGEVALWLTEVVV